MQKKHSISYFWSLCDLLWLCPEPDYQSQWNCRDCRRSLRWWSAGHLQRGNCCLLGWFPSGLFLFSSVGFRASGLHCANLSRPNWSDVTIIGYVMRESWTWSRSAAFLALCDLLYRLSSSKSIIGWSVWSFPAAILSTTCSNMFQDAPVAWNLNYKTDCCLSHQSFQAALAGELLAHTCIFVSVFCSMVGLLVCSYLETVPKKLIDTSLGIVAAWWQVFRQPHN